MPASKGLVSLALAALCLLALALRLHGISALLPWFTPLDGTVLVRQVELFRSADPDPDRDALYRYYPHVLPRTVAVLPAPEPAATGALEEHLEAAGAGWLELRYVGAILSLLILPASWFFVRRFFGMHAAFAACALLATSLLHISFTTQVRPHGTAASFLMLSVVAAIALRRRPGVWTYTAAGVVAGLAIGTLHYGVFALGPIVVAHALRLRPRDWRGWIGVAIVIAVVCVAFRCFYPFHFTNSGDFLRFERQQEEPTFNLSGQPLKLDRFNGRGFQTILFTLWSYEPVMLLLAASGAVILGARLARDRNRLDPDLVRDALVALAFVVPYGVVIGMYGETWERFVLALLPYFAALAGCAVACASTAPATRFGRRLGAAIAWTAIASTLAIAYRYGAVKARPDTLELTADWIRAHVEPTERVVLVPYFDVPLFHSEEALDKNSLRPAVSGWLRYQLQHRGPHAEPGYSLWIVPGERLEAHEALERDPLAYFEANGARYVVLETTFEPDTMLGRVRTAVASKGERVARFAPQPSEDGKGRGVLFRMPEEEWSMPFFLIALSIARLGPMIEIYRLH